MSAVIRTERLTKTYGEHRGITELDLEVAEGEIFGFLGPNGAGKTTTMRVLLDLIRPTSGRAEVFGIETTVDPVAIHRRVGYLPGEFDLYDRLTGAQTIAYFGNLRGGVDRAYVDALIERLDLDPSRKYKEYSRGNKQKVGLVVALQHKPDLLILDEPTSGLDPLVQQTFFALVREARDDGRSMFLSSHIIDEVDRMCDRVAIIRRGQARPGRFHRGDPRARVPPRRADVRVAGRAGRLRRAARRERRRGPGPHRPDARERADRVGHHRRGAAWTRRRRQPRTEPRGCLPRAIRRASDRRGHGGVTAEARVLTRPGPWARVFGLGSIYGKTVRDSRRAAILVGGVAAIFVIATGAPYATPDFATVELRQAFIASLTALPPAIRGLLGEPINLDTLGGFVSWRVGNFLPVMLGLWPVLALSGTLAGEAAKGSLDLVASTPHPRASIALEKLAGHVTAVAFAMAILALAIFGLGQAFARLPGDEIALSAAIGQAVLYGVMMLAAGGVAFATAPFLGRTRGLGLGLIALFASYLIYGYSTLSPIIEALKPLSFFVWTAGHRPIAGVTDWPSVALLAAVDVVLFAIGIIAFTRRDLGSSANVPWLRLPSLPAGTAGPFSRQLADRVGIALAWGVGIGAYGILIVASADAFGKMITSLPQLTAVIEAIYPGLDLTQPSALLQLTFFSFGSFILGLAGASFLAGWAGDEGNRRLEVVLSTPLSRASWAVRSGLGVSWPRSGS